MAALTPVPKIQFFDANGSPLVGGKLYSYDAGTTTPRSTYTNYGGATPNTNPVILDSRGEANVWLDTALYKLKLTSSTDVEIWTVDNIGGPDQTTLAQLAASGGSALVGFIQAGTGAVARTAQAKMRDTVSVLDFGADPTGVLDATAAIQAALNTGKNVFIPNGTYIVNPDTSVNAVSNQRITLEQEAVLQASASSSSGVYSVIRIFGVSNVIVEGGTIIGDRATHIGVLGESGMGIYVANSTNITIRDVKTKDCWGDGIYVGGTDLTGKSDKVRIENVTSDNNRRQGLTIAAGSDIVVDGGSFTNSNGAAPEAGIDIEPNPGKGAIENVVVQNVRCESNNGCGIAVSQTICKNVKLVNNTCVSNGLDGIRSGYIGSDLLVSGNTVTDNTDHGIHIFGDNAYITREIQIVNNTVKNNGLTGIYFYKNIIRFTVRGNIVFGNGEHGMSFQGVTSVCDNGIITDNFCESNSQKTNITYDNIYVGSLTHFLRLSHNTCRRGSLANTPAYGIRVVSNEAYWITDNDLYTGGQTGNYNGVFANITLQRNIGFKTENRVLSNTFPVDAVDTVTLTIAHGCAYTPATHHCQLTIVDPSALPFAEGAVKIQSVDATNVTARINVTTAAGAGTTARLALAVDRPSAL